MKVFWTPLARLRLLEIENYISQDKPAAARKLCAKLVERSLRLQTAPQMGKNFIFRAKINCTNYWCARSELFTGLRRSAWRSSR